MSLNLPTPTTPLKIGTRGSPLALAQAHETRARLSQAFDLEETCFEIIVIKTTGDRILDRPLKEIGGKGLFTREIEEDLLSGRIDIAVHSMKDMPTEQPAGLILDTYLPREDVRDAFVSLTKNGMDALEAGQKLGSSSLRRKAQLMLARPDLEVVEFRGNVQTRLKKLENGVADATFLAAAGLNRLGLSHIAKSFPGLMPDSSARSSLSEKARIDLPVRVLFRNQKTKPTTRNAVITVTPCEVLIARPSFRPVIFLKARAFMMKRSPSLKFWSFGPITKRISPL